MDICICTKHAIYLFIFLSDLGRVNLGDFFKTLDEIRTLSLGFPDEMRTYFGEFPNRNSLWNRKQATFLSWKIENPSLNFQNVSIKIRPKFNFFRKSGPNDLLTSFDFKIRKGLSDRCGMLSICIPNLDGM